MTTFTSAVIWGVSGAWSRSARVRATSIESHSCWVGFGRRVQSCRRSSVATASRASASSIASTLASRLRGGPTMPMRSCKTSGHTVASEGASRMPAPSPVVRTESFHCATSVYRSLGPPGAPRISRTPALDRMERIAGQRPSAPRPRCRQAGTRGNSHELPSLERARRDQRAGRAAGVWREAPPVGARAHRPDQDHRRASGRCREAPCPPRRGLPGWCRGCPWRRRQRGPWRLVRDYRDAHARGREKGADLGRSVEAGTERRSESCVTAQYCADPVGARGAQRARRGTS
jgi:hypothetical protein